MGIQFLHKNLEKIGCSSPYYSYMSNNKEFSNIDTTSIFVDFSSMFYTILFSNNDIRSFYDNVFKIFDQYKSCTITLFVDNGEILQKNIERQRRRIQISKNIEQSLKELHTLVQTLSESSFKDSISSKINDLIESKNITISERDENNNLESVLQESELNRRTYVVKKLFHISPFEKGNSLIIETIENITSIYKNVKIVYCTGIDAEYELANEVVKYYNKYKKVPLISSNDQDLTGLLLINLPIGFIISNTSFKNCLLAKNTVILSSIINKTDYTNGIDYLSFEISDKIIDRYVSIFSYDFHNNYNNIIAAYIFNFKKGKMKSDVTINSDVIIRFKTLCDLIKIYLNLHFLDNKFSFYTLNLKIFHTNYYELQYHFIRIYSSITFKDIPKEDELVIVDKEIYRKHNQILIFYSTIHDKTYRPDRTKIPLAIPL